MFLYGPEQQDLGFDPVSAIITGATLKNIFGIGKKKKARSENVAANKGYWASQFPPGTDFSPTLNNTPAVSGLGRRKGAKTLGEDYKAMYDHKDSWLVKNKVASGDDYAAYTILTSLQQGNPICDPKSTNKNNLSYKRCPIDRESGVNIFDQKAYDEWAAKQQGPAPVAKAPPTQAKQPSVQPASVSLPPIQSNLTDQGGILEKIAQIFAASQQAAFPQVPQPQAPVIVQPEPAQNELPEWVLPAVIGTVALGGVAFIMSRQKGRR